MADEEKVIELKYIGGGASLIGVPARDLTPEEVQRVGRAYLLASGLYKRVKKPAAFTPKPTKTALKVVLPDDDGEIPNV